jgi:beta-glucosidase
MRTLFRFSAVCLFFAARVVSASTTAPIPPWLDVSLPAEKREQLLISQMTLEEKVAQIDSDAPAIDRLGIAPFDYWNEALHGVAAQRTFASGYATVFPQCIGLAATWDPGLIKKVGEAISIEARAKNGGKGAVFFCPNVNIYRDPRWGRGQETWGEDPLLTSQMAVAFICGFQGDDPKYLRNAAVVKHFAVHSGPEDQRYTFDAFVSDRDLYDTYLPAFKACVQDGHVAGVMSAYNRLRGVPCTCNEMLLNGILRQLWGFNGFVISDASASTNIVGTHKFVDKMDEAAALTLGAGCDLPVGAGDLLVAVKEGMVSEEMVDRALCRVFAVRFRLGEFDPADRVPFANVSQKDVDSDEHRALARQAARESMVLLKNDGHFLPLSRTLKNIAVIGPNADVAHLGDYCGRPSKALTPYAAIVAAMPQANVTFAMGCGVTKDMQSLKPMLSSFLTPAQGKLGEHGLTAEYFDNDHFAGPPVLVRTDAKVDFNWGAASPIPQITTKHYSVRWTGKLSTPLSGAYPMTLFSAGSARLYLDGKLIVNDFDGHPQEMSEGIAHLDANKPHDICIEYVKSGDDSQIGLKAWGERWADATIAQAVSAAQSADVVILCVGTNPDHEGESLDRDTLAIPGDQEYLIEKVLEVGKPTVMVLMNGGAMTFDYAKRHATAILESWYPGEEGGPALADILFGDFNPSGRLPVTFYASDAQLPPFDDYRMEGRTYRYFKGEVEYPFGYGLSYSTFKLSHLVLTQDDTGGRRTAEVSADVTNTSEVEGDDVVEVYISKTTLSSLGAVKQLGASQRLRVAAGETKVVKLRIDLEQIEHFDSMRISDGRSGEYKIVITSGDGTELSARVVLK